MLPDYVVIGHVTRDIQRDGTSLPGGTVTYAALTARNLGRSVGVVTSMAEDLNLGSVFDGIELIRWPAEATTTFENIYLNGRREQYVQAVAPPLTLEHVPAEWLTAPLVHLGPVAMEVTEELVDAFPQALVGVTPQGWMRSWDTSGRVQHAAWTAAPHILARADVLILSEEDVGGDLSLLEVYLDMAKLAVVTDGWRGAVVYALDGTRRLPAYRVNEIEPTGAGDVFAAAYLIALSEDKDPYEAARFANAVASFSVEARGLSGIPSRCQAEDRVANGTVRSP